MNFDENIRLVGRRLIVGSPLDRDAATRICAELMTLDGLDPAPVDLLVSGQGDSVACVLPVVDTINTMRAPVNTRATGMATGAAGILVALGSGTRTAAAHALLSIRIATPTAEPGTSIDHLDTLVADHRQRLQSITELLTVRSGVAAAIIESELQRGDLHPPAAAVNLGLLDPPPA